MEKIRFEDMVRNFPCTKKLEKIRKCGNAKVISGELSMNVFTYLANDGLHIAEETRDGWKTRSGNEIHESALGFGAMLGVSSLSRTRFLYELPNDEAICLAAMMDLHGLAELRKKLRGACGACDAYAACGVETGAEYPVEAVRKALESEEGSYKLTDFIRINRPEIKADVEKALASLVEKKFCMTKDGYYFPNDELSLISAALAKPATEVHINLFEEKDGCAELSSLYGLQGSILDNLSVSFRDKSVVFCSMSSVHLLALIESTLALREPAEKTPNAEQNEEWVCACGKKSNGMFCPECGARRPDK